MQHLCAGAHGGRSRALDALRMKLGGGCEPPDGEQVLLTAEPALQPVLEYLWSLLS